MKVSLACRTLMDELSKYGDAKVVTHHSTSGAVVRRLGRIIETIFLPNQEAALVEPFANGLIGVGSHGLFSPYCINLRYEFYLRVLKVSLTSERNERVRDTFSTRR